MAGANHGACLCNVCQLEGPVGLVRKAALVVGHHAAHHVHAQVPAGTPLLLRQRIATGSSGASPLSSKVQRTHGRLPALSFEWQSS